MQAPHHLFGIVDKVDLIAERSRSGQPARVPGEVFARHLAAGFAAIMIEHHLIMFEHQRELHIDTGVGQLLPGIEPVHHLRQQPRPAISTAPDHQAVSARLFKRRGAVRDGADIAVDDHRDRDRVLDRANERPVCLAPVHLVAGAAMDGDHLHAQILCNPRQFGGVEAIVAPAHPHLDRDRHLNRLDGGLDQPCRQRNVAHQGGTGIAVDHLLYRAAHIDIDDRRAAIFDQLGCLAHLHRIAADQLHRDRILGGIPHCLLHRLPCFADRRGARDHLGNVEA